MGLVTFTLQGYPEMRRNAPGPIRGLQGVLKSPSRCSWQLTLPPLLSQYPTTG